MVLYSKDVHINISQCCIGETGCIIYVWRSDASIYPISAMYYFLIDALTIPHIALCVSSTIFAKWIHKPPGESILVWRQTDLNFTLKPETETGGDCGGEGEGGGGKDNSVS